jgi:cobalt-zinc-cadmium efflux system membrane fusion protein
MPIHDHEPTLRGRAFLWAGIGLGLLFLAAFLTRGFGLLGGPGKGEEGPGLMVRQGDKILVPEGSALRSRLTIQEASAQPVSAKLVLADAAKLTEKNLARQVAQNKLGVASDRDLDQARSDHTQAAAEYARTQTRLIILGGSSHDRPSSHLLTVTAPTAGSITTLSVAPGTMINDPTQALMTIADLSTIWVTALVPESEVAAVSKNQDANVALSAYPDRSWSGKILFVSDVIEPDSRRNKVRIAFANSDYALKPNMFATVTVVGPQRSQVVLPSSALLMNNDRTSVFIATAPWTFERRNVEPQLEEGSSVAIRSGVTAGEQVVVKGGILLND